MKKEALYKEFAEYYDLVYHNKNYKKESAKLVKLINKYKKSKGKDLLEVACGTGGHLQYLSKKYNCTGIDLNKEMLKIARKKVKGAKLKQANMISFNLNKKFDIIVCLFSSIAYAKTYKNLEKTIQNLSKHLKKGGVIIIEPFQQAKNNKSFKKPIIQVYKDDVDVNILRMSTSRKKDNNIIVLEMHYLIGEKQDKKVKINYFEEIHELGDFDINKTLNYLKKAGLKSKYLKHSFGKKKGLMDRGLFIGTKN